MNNLFKVPVLKTIIYFIIVGSIIAYFNLSPGYKTGPCNPGLDIISIFFAWVASIVLAFINIVRYNKKGGRYLPSILIPLVFVLGIIAALVFQI